jgi:hypothetical protein
MLESLIFHNEYFKKDSTIKNLRSVHNHNIFKIIINLFKRQYVLHHNLCCMRKKPIATLLWGECEDETHTPEMGT